MKKTYLSVLLLAASAITISFSSCHLACTKGSGKLITESRKISGFTQIDISGPFTVTLKQDSSATIAVTGDDNLMQKIKTDNDGDKLEIKTESNICTSGQINIQLGVKNLSSIKTAGEVILASVGKITTKDFTLDVAGVSKVTLNLSADNVTTTGSGLTDLNLTGQAKSHKVELSGSGQVDALDFVVGKYQIESSGATNFKINVLNDLDINSSGASDIEYRGNPGNINNNKSGIGSLKKIQ